ncbi:hypothetical protein TNCV_623591 [Trichonephila clavipes]|nr:hypothetical protein TNCV_623591 [Trichonephila clavipes]
MPDFRSIGSFEQMKMMMLRIMRQNVRFFSNSTRSIESTKTDWNCTSKSIFTCFAQTFDRLPRLTQTYPIMPDGMDMIESNID